MGSTIARIRAEFQGGVRAVFAPLFRTLAGEASRPRGPDDVSSPAVARRHPPPRSRTVPGRYAAGMVTTHDTAIMLTHQEVFGRVPTAEVFRRKLGRLSRE